MTGAFRLYFLVACILGALFLTSAVLLPFLKPLALAAVFAVVLRGVYTTISKWLGGWPSVSALLTVLVSVFVILLPLSLVGTLVANEARSLYASLENAGGSRSVASQMLLDADTVLGNRIPGLSAAAQDASAHVDEYTKEALQWVTQNAGGIFSGLSRLLLAFFIFFIALYYLLRDGARARHLLMTLSPLDDTEDAWILGRLERAINSVIRGNLSIALLQGILTTIGFSLFGVPSAILWGTVAAVAALIPGVGTGLVLFPAIAFLFFIGATPQAIGLLIWGVLAVGLIDNFLGPKLVGRGMDLHPLLVLLSVLGGLSLFGPSGIFLGPLAVSLLVALLSIYADLSHSPKA
jgi:predicted PurR-regulated permease PerM